MIQIRRFYHKFIGAPSGKIMGRKGVGIEDHPGLLTAALDDPPGLQSGHIRQQNFQDNHVRLEGIYQAHDLSAPAGHQNLVALILQFLQAELADVGFAVSQQDPAHGSASFGQGYTSSFSI
jgi:hypothetical protein